MDKKCICCSGQSYAECCQKFHRGAFPGNALELMRSRYSAYALNLADYIILTTDPQGKNFQLDRELSRKSIQHFSKHTQFKSLEIIEFIDGVNEAFVTFTAHLEQGGKPFDLHEKSRFVKVGPQWLYSEKL